MTKKLKITLIKSINGRLPKHKLIAKQLKLNKINKTVIYDDIPAIRGLVNKIDYLVAVEES